VRRAAKRLAGAAAAVLVADGSGEEVYATGLRNAVGFDWQPEDGQLYATDNGRDLLGDEFPPDERYGVGSLSEYLKTPKPPMPAFDLSDQQRADLAVFLLSRHP